MHHRLKSLSDVQFSDHPLSSKQPFSNQSPPSQNALALDHHHPHPLLSLKLPRRPTSRSSSRSRSRSQSPCFPAFPSAADPTAALSDELLLDVFSRLPPDSRDSAAALVCHRWLLLCGRLRRRLVLRAAHWHSLDRLLARFPNLTDLDLVPAAFSSSSPCRPGGGPRVLLTRGGFSIPMDRHWDPPIGQTPFVDSELVDRGLETVAKHSPNLRKLSVAGGGDVGLVLISDSCDTLQEMELHRCSDSTLRSISGFRNLQVLRLVASVEGLYTGSGVGDIGLTILAHGCKRLVKLELSGCEGSYDGISAIGRCCLMLEELTLCDHRMDDGWMAGLSFCGNLKTLRFQSCRRIDGDPGPLEHLGSCPTIETLQMLRCQLRDKRSLGALFTMCGSAREIMFRNCWGLDDEMFGTTSICRRVKLLSMEGCSQLTTEGLESVVLSWTELKSLTVVSCNNVKDEAVSPALSNLFAILKEFKWRPDSKSVLAMNLMGAGMGKKGGRFFKRG